MLSGIFAGLGGEAGRGLPELLRQVGIEEPGIDAHVIALKPGHPYLRMPLQFSVALESRLLETLSEDELASLRSEAEAELAEPGNMGHDLHPDSELGQARRLRAGGSGTAVVPSPQPRSSTLSPSLTPISRQGPLRSLACSARCA